MLPLAMCIQASAAVYIDDDGWTVVTPSVDSRIVYVSNSEGNDSNNGLSPSTPKKTILAGDALIRDGYPDHLLLKRGDVFPTESNYLLGRWKNGRSAQEPILFSYYGESGPRPVVKVIRSALGHGNYERDYQAVIGIDFYRAIADPNSPDFDNTDGLTGFSLVGGGRDFLIEDCRLRFMSIVIQSSGGLVYLVSAAIS
jgi:hypothetical protein